MDIKKSQQFLLRPNSAHALSEIVTRSRRGLIHYYYLLLFLSGTAPRKNLVEIETSKGIICIALAE